MDSVDSFAYRQRGATLVELLVALALGLLVVAGAAQLFVGMRQTFALASDVSARQAETSFVTQELLRQVRTAEAIEIDGGALRLMLNGEQSTAYCSAAQASLELTYRREGGALIVEPDCPQEGSVLMTGVEDFAPTPIGADPPYGVALALTLAKTERLPARTQAFHAVSRELALRQALKKQE